MAVLSPVLRSVQTGWAHWCPGCRMMHILPKLSKDGWKFDGDVQVPTFKPSFSHTWEFGGHPEDKKLKVKKCCHYIITAGKIDFCADCTHDLAGKTDVPMPVIPETVQLGNPGCE